MKIRLKTAAICAAFILSLAKAFGEAPDTEKKIMSEKCAVRLSVDTSKASVFKKTAFGMNAAVWSPGIRHDHPDYIHKYIESGSQFVRFPGGTLANHYKWQDSVYEIPDLGRKSARKTQFRWNTDTFLRFADETGTQFAVVLNIFTNTPEENAEWLRYLKSKGHSVKFIEIGNELYLSWYRYKFKTVKSYIEAARLHVEAAKAVFPEAKTGLTITATGYNQNVVISYEEGQGA